MNIVEKSVSAGDRAVFDLDEFLSRPQPRPTGRLDLQRPRGAGDGDGVNVAVAGRQR